MVIKTCINEQVVNKIYCNYPCNYRLLRILQLVTMINIKRRELVYHQSVSSTGNGVSLSGLTEFVFQFKSQESRICWENLYLPIRVENFNLDCGASLKVPCTVEALLKIPRG